jgi:hypothetical protein
MKKSWADIEEEERVQNVPPSDRKAPKPVLVDGVSKETKVPDTRN